MICKECEHFKIVQYPLRSGGVCWDNGIAKCEKHNLEADFLDMRGVNRLRCVEKEGNA